MVIKNFTPHPIVINGIKYVSEGVARVKVQQISVGNLWEEDNDVLIPVTNNQYGEIEGLPEYKEGYCYIVSKMVHDVAVKKGRMDTFFPDKLIRDSEGNIIGCQALGQNC